MRPVAALKCKKKKGFLNFGPSPTCSTKHPQSRCGRSDSMRHQVATATPGRCAHSVTFSSSPFKPQSSNPLLFSLGGAGAVHIHPGLAAVACWWWDGGLGQLPHAERDYCAKALLAQEVNGPLIRCYSTMACMQVKFRASKGGDWLPWTIPPPHALAAQRATNSELGAPAAASSDFCLHVCLYKSSRPPSCVPIRCLVVWVLRDIVQHGAASLWW